MQRSAQTRWQMYPREEWKHAGEFRQRGNGSGPGEAIEENKLNNKYEY